MRRFSFALTAATVLVASGTLMSGSASAAPVGAPDGVRAAVDTLKLTENVQYFWGGHNYCWDDDGWNGPGWYWCGYEGRRGYGWGGGYGWGAGRGWRGGGHGGHGGHGGGGGMGGGGGGGMGGGGGGGMGGGGGGGMGGGGGGGMGGGGGGGMGMSDIRAKHDIVLLGHLDNGLGFYRFSYNGSDKAYVGVMAQEVLTIRPEAVARGSDGYLRVNYDLLGLQMQSWDEWLASGERIPATAPGRH
jgi:hypothetical protein